MFKKKRPVVFDSGDSSDDDTVATDSTAESAELEVYPVEHILDESEMPGEGIRYLINWEGYPLARATWEPAENITANSIWQQWERQKQAVQEGKAKPFDSLAFLAAVDDYEKRRAERRRRRKVKRRKRGLPESPNRVEDSEADHDEEHDENDGQIDDPPTNSHRRADSVQRPVSNSVRRHTSPVARKGIARRVSRRPRVESSVSSSDGQSSGGSSSEDDLADSRLATKPVRRPVPATTSVAEAVASKIVLAGKTREPPSLASMPRSKTISKRTSSAAPVAARKSAPGGAAANAPPVTDRDVLANWTAKRTRRQRPRVSGETPKDSSDPSFRKLSTQRRFQLYGRNETEPDINALNLVNLQTGQVMPPRATETPSAYLRRTPPPVAREATVSSDTERRRQISGSSAPTAPVKRKQQCHLFLHDECPYSAATCPNLHLKSTCHFWLTKRGCAMGDDCKYAHEDTGFYAPAPGGVNRFEPSRSKDTITRTNDVAMPMSASVADLSDKKIATCYFWQHGGCKYADDQCNYAHYDTGKYADAPPSFKPRPSVGSQPAMRIALPKETTCYYWRRGHCDKKEEMCNFAHRDTGIYAGRPGSFKKDSLVAMVPVEPNVAMNADMIPVGSRPSLPSMTQNQGANVPNPQQTHELPLGIESSPAADFGPSPMEITASPVQREQAPHSALDMRGIMATRRPSMAPEALDADLVVSFAGDDPPLQLQATLVTQDLAKLTSVAGARPHIRVSQMNVAADFERYIHNGVAQRDDMNAAGGMTIANVHVAQQLISLCKLHACGLVASLDDHTLKMLIYPSDAEGWKFFDEPGRKFETPLTFRVLQIPPIVVASPPRMEDDKRPSTVAIGEDLAGLDIERLLNKDGQLDVKAVFLMFPPTRQTELEIYVDIFTALVPKVYHSAMPGAWAHFRKLIKGNLLLIHADVPISRIPSFHGLLQNTNCKVFRVGQSMQDLDNASDCERLCPYGTVVLIPDTLFAYHPEDATEIIQYFLISNKMKNDGAEFNRIVARPGVKLWLEKLALQSQERGRKDSRWVKLYTAMCQLCPDEAEDPDDVFNPLPTSWLVSLSPELLPSYSPLWEKDEEAATEYLVNWFAGWSIENASNFRKFYIAHPNHSGASGTSENLDPKGWGNKYQHVGVRYAKEVFRKK